MSQTIRWKQRRPSEAALPVATPSAFIGAMQRAFGSPPWILSPAKDMLKLEGMAAAYGTSHQNPYFKLIEIMNNIGGDEPVEIEIWPE